MFFIDDVVVRECLLKYADKNKKIIKDFQERHQPKSWWRRLFG